MNIEQWTLRCAQQLAQQWPRVGASDLEHLAEALGTEPRWRSMEPGEAAIEWLRQGIPTAGASSGEPSRH